jgi:hypothetical protein
MVPRGNYGPCRDASNFATGFWACSDYRSLRAPSSLGAQTRPVEDQPMRHRIKFSHCSRSAENGAQYEARKAPLFGLHSPLKLGSTLLSGALSLACTHSGCRLAFLSLPFRCFSMRFESTGGR